MKELQLTDGSVTLVDNEDYRFLVRHQWRPEKMVAA